MTTLTPLRPEAENKTAASEQMLIAALHAWRRRLTIQQTLRLVESGGIAGMLLAALLLLVARFTPWASVLYWAAALFLFFLLCALGIAFYARPSLAASARRVDALLAFHDRLSTAWEYRSHTTILPALQRRDALARLSRHTPASVISLRPGRVRLATFAAALIALALLLLLPNPMNAVLQQQAAFQNSIASQIAKLDHIRTIIDSQATTPAQTRDQLDKILRQAESQLQQAKNAAQAQQILAQTQQKINQLRDPNAPDKANASAAASSTLQSSSNANVKAVGKALATGNKQALSNALQQLASQLNNLTSSQRAQLAQQVQQAANQAAGNPQLSSALQQLAKAVADGNASDVASAIKAVQNAAAQDSASQSTSGSIDQASQTLQNIANALASSTDSSTSQTPIQGANPGNGRTPGQTQSPGQGNQGTGGQGSAGNKSGKHEQVYVPGQVGSGNSAIKGNGDSGAVQPGTSVSYSQVLAHYIQMAHDAIDNSNIPPDLKGIISGYYNSLEGQK